MVGIKSDKGRVRSLNEDYASYYEKDNLKVYVLADGMGGHNAGEVASKLAVDTVINYFKNNEEGEKSLKNAVLLANKNIHDLALKEKSYGGMGTTITACLISEKKIKIANVGDSCCLGIKDGNISKLTKDHSLVQELIDVGSITEEQGANHPKKNVITRALGTFSEVEVDIYDISNDNYKLLLLCTDGLTNEITKEEILNIVSNNQNLDVACDSLISLAKERGGRDNITVLLFGGEV